MLVVEYIFSGAFLVVDSREDGRLSALVAAEGEGHVHVYEDCVFGGRVGPIYVAVSLFVLSEVVCAFGVFKEGAWVLLDCAVRRLDFVVPVNVVQAVRGFQGVDVLTRHGKEVRHCDQFLCDAAFYHCRGCANDDACTVRNDDYNVLRGDG